MSDPAGLADGSVDPAWLIGQLRAFLPTPTQPSTAPNAARQQQAEPFSANREQAGEALWDLAASPAQAQALEKLGLVDCAPALLCDALQHGQLRIAELMVGILGNLVCHQASARTVIASSGIRQLAADLLRELEDAPCLAELCRLCSSCISQEAGPEWRQALLAATPRWALLLSRMLWCLLCRMVLASAAPALLFRELLFTF